MAPHRYEEVAGLVKASLGNAGAALPAEYDLAEQYGVSRNTIRKALDSLETEGLIISTQGRLRMVRDTRRWRYDMNRWETRHRPGADAWTATVTEQGAEDAASDIDVRYVATTEEIGAALNVEEGAPIITRARVHRIAGHPHQLSDSFYPPWVTDGYPAYRRPANVSEPGGLLAASGHPQVRFHDVISTRLPTPEEAQQLRMPATTPLLIHSRTGYDAKDRPVRHQVTRMPADRVEVTYDLPNG